MDVELEGNTSVSTETISLVEKFYNNSMVELKNGLDRFKISDCKNLSQKYDLHKDKKFNMQYSQLYYCRINQLQGALHQRLGDLNYKPMRIIEVKKDMQVAICGTLYKTMKLKPNIIQKMTADEKDTPRKSQSFVSEDDHIYIEDETAKTKLEFTMDSVFRCNDPTVNNTQCTVASLITGMVVAIVGATDSRGTVHVSQVVLADILTQSSNVLYTTFVTNAKNLKIDDPSSFQNQHALKYYTSSVETDDRFIVLASGLNISNYEEKSNVSILKAFLFGGLASVPLSKVHNCRLQSLTLLTASFEDC